MIAVITGDIVNSRTTAATKWQPILKKVLNQYGKTPKEWEIYRGDSFQLCVSPDIAFTAALHIKSSIKQIAALDVRMSIGIGTIDNRASKLTASTGSAFTRSGESFDILKRQTLAIASGNAEIDETLNLMFGLALLSINNWSETVAAIIKTSIEHPQKNQSELAELLQKTQSSISEALKRGGYEEVKKLEQYYKNKIASL